jgi:hypothetical protein
MKTLDVLVRVKRQELDSKRHAKTVLENQASQLEIVIDNLRKSLYAEHQLVDSNPEFAPFYGGFAARNTKLQHDVKEELDKITIRIEQLAEEIFEAFVELKKFELLYKEQQQRENKELENKEEAALNELTVNRYNYKEQHNE